MIRHFNCVEPCSGYAMAATGIHGAGFKTAYAFDNNCWDEKSQQYKLLAVENYNANFKHDDGSDVCHLRDITTITGKEILDEVSRISGWKSVHFMLGGPPCQQWSPLNSCDDGTEKCLLILEYLRLVSEVRPLVAVMEQVPKFLKPKNSEGVKIRNEFFRMLKDIGYSVAYTTLNSSDYGVPQDRIRAFVMLVRNDLNMKPVFPSPIYPKVPITKFIDIDGFSSGHFGEPMKSVELHAQVCTVTSSSPKWFYKNADSWKPSVGELLWCQSINPAQYKHVGSESKLRKGIGNGIPAMMAYHLSRCVIDNILEPAFALHPELF